MRRLRRFYWRVIRRYRFELCHACGRRVEVAWTAPDDLWERAARLPEHKGIRCIPCFDRECLDEGLSVRWRPHVETAHPVLVDGRGRVIPQYRLADHNEIWNSPMEVYE